jgi:hypothetical protein
MAEIFPALYRLLGPGDALPQGSKSDCVFTCFNRLTVDVHYWACGLPRTEDVCDGWIGDGGVWGQPFRFKDLAHIVIPRTFDTEHYGEDGSSFEYKEQHQNIAALSQALTAEEIDHRLTDLVLEIKYY